MNLHRMLVGIACIVAAASGCVSAANHDDAIGRIERDRVRIVAQNRRIAACDDRLVAERRKSRSLENAVDRQTALSQELRRRLEEMGENVDLLTAHKGFLTSTLRETEGKLAAVRRAQQAADARAALFRDLALRFKRMVDAGHVDVRLRDGRMVIALPNDVLFDSGQIDIKPAGRKALEQVAGVLATLGDRHLQVAGHTDDVPIMTARFPSNWELSSGRALEVTRFLLAAGVAPEVLSAAGYGEHDPIAANETPEGRQKNRRIEITLVPTIDEMVDVPVR